MEELKDRMLMAMKIRGFRQVDLASKISELTENGYERITKGQLSSYIHGTYEPNAAKLMTLAKALEVSEAYLMGYDVPMERTPQQKKNDQLSKLTVRLLHDEDFQKAVILLDALDDEKLKAVCSLLQMQIPREQEI